MSVSKVQRRVSVSVSAERVEGEFGVDASLWLVLAQLGKDDVIARCHDDGRWLSPKLSILNRPFVGLDALLTTTLQSAGVGAGRNLIRITGFDVTDLTLAHVLERAAHAAEPKPRVSAPASPLADDPPAAATEPSDAVVAAFAAAERASLQPQPQPQPRPQPQPVVETPPVAATTEPRPAEEQVAAESANPPPFVPDPSLDVARNVRVLGVRALQSAGQREAEPLPDEFYEVTPEDLKAVQSSTQKRKQMDEQLMTREMRERHKKRYLLTKLRIKMPDRIEIEATFSVMETLGDVVKFVREQLRDESWPFYLFVTPPRTVLSALQYEATLGELELVPAAVLMLAFGTPRVALKVDQPFLKPALLADITEHDFVDLSSAAAGHTAAPEEPAARSANEKLLSIMQKLRSEKKPAAADGAGAAANGDDDDADVDDKATPAAAAASNERKVPKWLKLSKKK